MLCAYMYKSTAYSAYKVRDFVIIWKKKIKKNRNQPYMMRNLIDKKLNKWNSMFFFVLEGHVVHMYHFITSQINECFFNHWNQGHFTKLHTTFLCVTYLTLQSIFTLCIIYFIHVHMRNNFYEHAWSAVGSLLNEPLFLKSANFCYLLSITVLHNT